MHIQMTDDRLVQSVENNNNGGNDIISVTQSSTTTRTLSPPSLHKPVHTTESSILRCTHIVPISEDNEWNDYTEQQANLQQLQSITESVRALYVDEHLISKHLKCIICTLPYVKPITHSACGNVFCANCVSSIQSDLCPCCRKPLKNKALLSANVPLRGMLDELRIKCPSCYCEMRRDQLPMHTSNGCSPSALCTQSCGKLILHNYQAEHSELHCEQTILQCPAEDIGCTVQCNRIDMESHKSQCKLLVTKYALTALRDRIDSMDNTIKSKNDEIQSLRTQLINPALPSVKPVQPSTTSTSASSTHTTAPTNERQLTLTISRSSSEHRSSSTRISSTPTHTIDLRRSQSHSPPSTGNQRKIIRHLPGGKSREAVCAIM